MAMQFLDDLRHWQSTNAKIAKKVLDQVDEIMRSTRVGTGKPKTLTGNLKGKQSRRLTEKDRLVYEVKDETVEFLSCRFHYDD
jgi:toxin YoeB